MNSKIYFISGVNGVGKTSVIPYLEKLLPSDKYVIHDFDKRGVPDGADRTWRINETRHWLEEGAVAAKRGLSTIVCGFAKKSDFDGLSSSETPEVDVILLDADAETIRKRLVGRYTKDGVFDENQKVIGKPVNEFIAGNVYYVNIMRKECEADGCKVVDTDTKTLAEVAEEVARIIES